MILWIEIMCWYQVFESDYNFEQINLVLKYNIILFNIEKVWWLGRYYLDIGKVAFEETYLTKIVLFAIIKSRVLILV